MLFSCKRVFHLTVKNIFPCRLVSPCTILLGTVFCYAIVEWFSWHLGSFGVGEILTELALSSAIPAIPVNLCFISFLVLSCGTQSILSPASLRSWGRPLSRSLLTASEIGTPMPWHLYIAFVSAALCRAGVFGVKAEKIRDKWKLQKLVGGK